MLRQEDPNSELNIAELDAAAARTRVTPEELARALSALEARKESDARHLDGTISIGQAVQELELDATPAEVWAEVQAQRSASQSSAPTPPTAAPSASATPPEVSAPSVPPLHQTIAQSLREAAVAAAPGLKNAAQAATPALRQGWEAVSKHAAAHKASRVRKPIKKGAKITAAIGVTLGLIGAIMGGVQDSHAHWEPLSAAADHHAVLGDTATVAQIAHGASPASVRVKDGGELDNGWHIIRHNGHTYVRGWILPTSTAALQTGAVKLYNDDDAGILEGVHVEEVTLPLDGLTLDGTSGSDDWSELDISHIHPDDHLQEDW